MLKRIKKWLYSKPSRDDLFGVRIREAYQFLFPCKHEWVLQDEQTRRYCDICGRRQYKGYHWFGPVRLSWFDYADID